MRLAFSTTLALAIVIGAPIEARAANTLIVGTLVSDPPDAQVNVRLEKGRKAVRVRMRWVNEFGIDQPGGFPIDISGANVTLTIAGTPKSCTRNVINPAVGSCGFVAAPFGAIGDVDTLWIYNNGDLPGSSTVQAAVGGVKAFDGSSQDPTNNTVTFTTGTDPARTGASLELVVDISGSMGTGVTKDPQPTRLDVVKTAATTLFNMLTGHAMLGDQVGVVFFSDPPATGGLLQPAHDPAQITAARNSVNSQVPTNSTSIGAGLNQANISGGLGNTPNTRKFVMLFSDGEQNSGDQVTTSGSSIKVGSSTYPASIHVCPITAGDQSAKGFNLQQQIGSAACEGRNLHLDSSGKFPEADMNTFFVQSLSDALIGDKLETVKDVRGSVGIGATKTEHFLGNTRDTAISVLLSWTGGRTNTLRMKLTAPDGTVVDTTNFTRSTINSRFTTLHFPLRQGATNVAPRGQWTVDVISAALEGQSTDYQLLVIADNETLATDPVINVFDPGTGEPIPMRVTITEKGAPVSGATVTADLVGPHHGLGDALANAPQPSGTPNVGGDIVGSAAKAKLLLLLNDPAFRAQIQSEPLPDVTMHDSGGNGVYTGAFNGATREGHYQFQIGIHGSTADNGEFERTRRVSVFVRPKPNAARTELALVSRATTAAGTVVTIRATPRDRFGSLLGPDYPPQLAINSSLGTVSSPLTDRLDGTYEIAYLLPSPTDDPTITLVIMGDTVKSAPVSHLPPPGSGGGGGAGKFAVSAHLGGTIPHGALASGFDGSVSVGADFDYTLTPMLSLESYFGYDRFTSKTGGDDGSFTNLSQRVRVTAPAGTVRPFAFAGLGVYFDSGSAHLGEGLGGGAEMHVTPQVSVEGTYTFHNVHASGGNARYSTITGGVRIRF